MWEADSLKSFNGDDNDQEDAQSKEEMTTTFEEGKHNFHGHITVSKVMRQDKKVEQEEKNVGQAKKGEKSVEDINHRAVEMSH